MNFENEELMDSYPDDFEDDYEDDDDNSWFRGQPESDPEEAPYDTYDDDVPDVPSYAEIPPPPPMRIPDPPHIPDPITEIPAPPPERYPEIPAPPAYSNSGILPEESVEDAYERLLGADAEPEKTEEPAPEPVPEAAAVPAAKSKSKSKKKKKKKRRRKHRSARVYGVLIMLTLIFVISITLAVGLIEVGKDLLGYQGTDTLIVFNIPEGATTAEIAQELADNGIIKIPQAFIYFSRLSEADSKYIAGDHQVSSAMAYETLISELTGTAMDAKNVDIVDVMFPEGITLIDAAMKLQDANVCDAQRFLYFFNAGNLGYSFETHLPENSNLKFMRMEGYLFPDTYTFYEGMDPEDVCQKIYVNFDTKITQEMYDRIDELGTTLDEVITMASMVQAEAANAEEMPKIASVFWNRLDESNWDEVHGKLQSDPTSKYVTYVIKPNIELPNQQMYDAYDTYVCSGLPAGAINNPGLEAINAVLWPAKTRYLYFYANIDTGKTYFAKTLEEQEANIQKVEDERNGVTEEDEDGEDE